MLCLAEISIFSVPLRSKKEGLMWIPLPFVCLSVCYKVKSTDVLLDVNEIQYRSSSQKRLVNFIRL